MSAKQDHFAAPMRKCRNQRRNFDYTKILCSQSQWTMPETSLPDAEPRLARHNSRLLLTKLTSFIWPELEDREGIKAVLDAAHDRQVLESEPYG